MPAVGTDREKPQSGVGLGLGPLQYNDPSGTGPSVKNPVIDSGLLPGPRSKGRFSPAVNVAAIGSEPGGPVEVCED